MIEAGCWAHARRKFFDAHKLNHSEIAKQALQWIAELYAIEREAKDLDIEDRLAIRRTRSKPLLSEFKAWLLGMSPDVEVVRPRELRAELRRCHAEGAHQSSHCS